MVQDHWPVGSEPQFVTTLGYSWTQSHGGDSDVGRGWRRCPNRYGSGARAFWSTDTSLSVARWVGDGARCGMLLRPEPLAGYGRLIMSAAVEVPVDLRSSFSKSVSPAMYKAELRRHVEHVRCYL